MKFTYLTGDHTMPFVMIITALAFVMVANIFVGPSALATSGYLF